MSALVCTGAMLLCSSGGAPSQLNIPPEKKVTLAGKPAANIADHLPGKNIMPFGACTITQSPCSPLLASPWTPGATTVLISGQPALHANCRLVCTRGGMISITNPGQMNVNVPG